VTLGATVVTVTLMIVMNGDKKSVRAFERRIDGRNENIKRHAGGVNFVARARCAAKVIMIREGHRITLKHAEIHLCPSVCFCGFFDHR
jgi:hypothetical protein